LVGVFFLGFERWTLVVLMALENFGGFKTVIDFLGSQKSVKGIFRQKNSPKGSMSGPPI
jgi:hypothetical protein